MSKTKSEAKEQSAIRWIIGATKPYHGMVLFISFLAIVSAVVSLWSAVLLKDLIDTAAARNWDLMIRIAVILGIVTLSSIALSLLSHFLKERTYYLTINSLQSRLISTILDKNYSQVTRFHSQEWLNRINEDSLSVAQAMCMMVPGFVGIIFQFLGAIYLCAKAAPSFLAFVIIGGFAIVVLNYSIKKPVKQAQRRVRNSIGNKNVFVSEHLSKLMIVKAFSREAITIDGVDEKLSDMYQHRMKRLRILLAKDLLQNGSANIALLAILIYCAIKIYKGNITYGTCLMLLRLLSQIRTPLSEVSSYISNIFDVIVAAERLMEAESFSEDLDQPVKAMRKSHLFTRIVFEKSYSRT